MNLLTKVNFFHVGIFLLGFLAWKIFSFSHPYPKETLHSTFWFLFCIPFSGYLYSFRLGRVLLVFLGLSATRLTSTAFHNEVELVTNAPIFLGGVLGLFVRANFLENSSLNPKTRVRMHEFLIFFLWVLILDRFLVYYNFPFFHQVGMQELLYTPRFTSKMALAFSSEIFAGLVLPSLYFLSEEFYRKGSYKKDLFLGILITLCVNGVVIGIQTFININFFSFQTNLAPTYGRATGLFRDAGSASFIFPTLLLFVFFHILQWKVKKKIFILFGFLVLALVLGKSLGRAYWIFWISSIPYLVLYKGKHFWKKILILGGIFVIFTPFALRSFLVRNPEFFTNLLEGNWKHLDSARFFLNKVAWYSFLQSPFFGNGMGSFPIALDDPNHPVPNPTQIIDSPMFLFGLGNDLGILGTSFLISYLVYTSLSYKNTFGIWMLFVSLVVGYHVYHPDNSFWILLMLGPLNSKRLNVSLKWKKVLEWFFILIIFLYIFHVTYKFFSAEKVPNFRYETTQKYQLQAYSINHQTRVGDFDFEYHNFLGSVIWHIQHTSPSLQIHFFLSDFTKKESLQLKLVYLDKNYQILGSQIISIHKWERLPQELKLPPSTEYLQIEELDEKGRSIKLGNHIYSVSQKNFDEKNQIISLSK